MATEMSGQIQSILANGLTNLSATNPNTPSHHVRKEGWTEVFGNLTAYDASKTAPSSELSSAGTSAGTRSMIHIGSNKDPRNIQVSQYRMCWTVQLLLRIYSIPHQVINTPYISNQSTGAYPQYRNIPSRLIIGNRDILPHLAEELKVEQGIGLTFHQRSECHCLSSLLDQLDFILKGLRYGDKDSWEHIYKKQCIRGTTLHTNSYEQKSFDHDDIGYWNGFAWYQAWAERAVYMNEVKNGLGSGFSSNSRQMHDKLDIDQLISLAREGYAALDSKLERGDGTLLGTESLTVEDIRLFGHLAEALCDVNLVKALAEKKNLITFFQGVYQKYFGKDYLMESIAANENSGEDGKEKGNQEIESLAWIKANDRVNASNQFNRIPMNGSFKIKSAKGDGYKDAIEIMQTVALHCHDLREVLADMALQRAEEDALKAKSSIGSKSGSLLNKWLMGGDLEMNSNNDDVPGDGDNDDADEGTNAKQIKQMMKEAKKNDEIWITGVICATAIGLLASSNAAR